MKICKICKINKDESEYNSCGSYKGKKAYRRECKLCSKVKYLEVNKQAWRNYHKNNKEKRMAYKKTDKYKESQRIYEAKRLKENKLFRLKKRIRDRTNKAIKAKNFVKKDNFYNYIGCTVEFLKEYLEKQFKENMNWDNHGLKDGFWHIDHIIPLSSAQTEEEMYKLCHFSNLQPMWAKDNIKKGNK